VRSQRAPRRRNATDLQSQLHAQLIEQLPGMVFRMTTDAPVAHVTYVSPQAEAILGYPTQSWLDDREQWDRLIHPEDRDRILDSWRSCVATGTPFWAEYRLRHADGSWVWLQQDVRPILGADGRIEAWQGLSLPITEQRQAQEARRDTEARYRALVEQLPAVVYVDSDDPSPRSLYVSPTSERILGHSDEAYRADPTLWPRTIHSDDRERVLTEWAEAVRTGEPFHTTYRFIRPDGDPVWVRDTSILIRGDDGAPLYWQGVILDVSAQARAEQDAREQHARYEALVDGIPAVVYEMDLDDERRTLYVNHHIEELLGYTRKEWLDQPDIWTELLHPDDRELELDAHDRHTESGEPWRREYRLIAADGRVVWVRDQAVLVRDHDGRPLTWQGVMLDITTQKEAEEQLRTAKDELEFRVLARTSQLVDANELMSLEIGERRRAERELWEARERYRLLVEELPAVIYIWQTREGSDEEDQSYVSPQIEQLLGFTPAEWHGGWHVWESRLHPHDHGAVMVATQHTVQTGEPFQMEYRYLAKDGRIVWVLDQATLLTRDEEGRPLILQGVMMDITDRKTAEHKAAEAEARIRDMTEESPVSTWAMDVSYETDPPTTTVEYVGPRIAETLGYPVSRWIDDPSEWFAMIHPDDRERVLEMTAQNLSHGTSWAVDFRMIAADGNVVWVHDRGRCVQRDERGRPVRFVGAVFDVTAQQEALTAAQAEAATMRTLVEGIPAVSWTELADTEGNWRRFAYIGPQAVDLFGYEAEELMNEPGHFERMVHPDDLPRVLARTELANETGAPWVDEFRARHRDGTYRWYHSAARRVSADGEVPAVWQGVTVDITAHRSGSDPGQRVIELEELGGVGSPDAPAPGR
jgi:PAS domain S-box-containing protein